MIEIIYKTKEEPPKEMLTIKTPKNVKQIGIIEENRKIYVEDYVMNYLKKAPFAEKKAKYGVLLGQAQKNGNQTYLFIRGIVEAQSEQNAIEFDEMVWNNIYKDIKQYYPKEKIVGWYLSIPYHVKGDWEQLKKMHIDYFAGSEKICYFWDRTDRQEGFFAYENGDMERINGYYIYYEKNSQLQQYFLDKNQKDISQNENLSAQEKNIKSTSIGGQFQQIPHLKKHSKRCLTSYITFTISAAAIAAGVMAIQKYSDIKNLNQDMAKIMQATRKNLDFNKTEVEKVNGNISTTQENENIISSEKKEQSTQTTTPKTPQTELKTETQTTYQKRQKEESQEKNQETLQTITQKTSQTVPQTTSQTPTQSKNIQSNQVLKNEIPQYTVKKGETLFEICIKIYNDANMLEQLKRVNNLDDSCKLKEGQKIILP